MFNKLMLLGQLTVLTLTTLAQVTPSTPYVIPNTDWVTHFSSRGNITNAPTAIDANGSMFLTGYTGLNASSCNILTQKRDSTGALIYTAIYNNGNYDKGSAIKISGTDAYVTGVSFDVATNNDYIVLKYGATGNQVWAYRFDLANNDDEAVDIKLDNSGNSYVTGKAKNSSGDFDIVTLKIDATGSLVWSHTYNGISSMDDIASGLVIIGGYVYVGGNSQDAGTGNDAIVYKLDASNGTFVWKTTINGTANGNDKVNGIVISGADVLICGEIDNTGTGLDAFLARIDGTSGGVVYQQDYDFGNSVNKATSLVRDSTGNVGVIGLVLNGSLFEYHTNFYDSTGTHVWVNIEQTNLTTLTVEPRIACDTIAHHFYVCGEKMNTSRDILAYQLTPTGNTSWIKTYDGHNSSDIDAGIGLAVNGVGVVYLAALSETTAGTYDYTSIKINQTPVYFPPDIVTGENPSPQHLYYSNRGQLVDIGTSNLNNDVLFSTMEYAYPYSYFLKDRIVYKFSNLSNVAANADTIQRVDFKMINSNPYAEAFPFEPKHGTVSYMQSILPDAVTGIEGYERYFIPNVYAGIDLHYFSNQNGLKMYYVLKPGASVSAIKFEVVGSSGSGIVGGKLKIAGFNDTVIFQQPKAYTVNFLGQPTALTGTGTANWTYAGTYGFSLPAYNSALPVIVELSYSNAVNTTTVNNKNLTWSTYYGGRGNEGFVSIDVDDITGNFVTLAEIEARILGIAQQFPTVVGSTISISTSTMPMNYGNMFGVVLFDEQGVRKAANTYGTHKKLGFNPLKAVLHRNLITVVGNAEFADSTGLPLYTSTGPLTSGTYFNNKLEGFVLQFSFDPVPSLGLGAGNINKILWATRMNGFVSDIAKTPDGKNLYISSMSDAFDGADDLPKTGAYNNSSFINNYNPNFKISKFDSVGHREWASLLQISNDMVDEVYPANSLGAGSFDFKSNKKYAKCMIVCNKTGFFLAGETDNNGMYTYSKYSVPVDNTYNGDTDGFVCRFDKQDNIVFSTYVGSWGDDLYNDIALSSENEAVMVGYSDSYIAGTIPTAQGANNFIDTIVGRKLLISKFDTLGNKTWSTLYGSASTGSCVGWSVTSDLYGKVFVSGRDAVGGFTFRSPGNPPNAYVDTVYKGGNSDAFMLCFNALNYPMWSTRFGGLDEEAGLDLAFHYRRNGVLLTGLTNSYHSNGTINNGAGDFPIQINTTNQFAWKQTLLNQITNPLLTEYDGFISFFENSQIVDIENYFSDKAMTDAFNLFPNPATDNCTLAIKNELKGNVKIEVYNQLGQIVISEMKSNVSASTILLIETRKLVAGVYIINLINGDVKHSKKLIINR